MRCFTNNTRFFDSPVISFNLKKGSIVISGRSIQMNSYKFWQSMQVRLIDFSRNTKELRSIRFQMEYIHSSSIKQLLDFLELSKNLTVNHGKLEVEWIYESGDEDMLEIGNYINEIVDLPIKYIQKNTHFMD